MRITIVSSLDYSRSGAAMNRHLGLVSALASRGNQVTVFSPTSMHASEMRRSAPAAEWFTLGSPVAPVGLLGGRADRLRTWRGVRHLLHGSAPPDVVLCFDRDPIVLGRARKLANSFRAKLVHELTEYPDVVAPSGLYGYLYLKSFEKRHIYSLDGALVISSALGDYVSMRAPALPVLRLPMLVDTNRFRSHRERHISGTPGALTIGYAGSLDPQKDGLDHLIKAVAQAKRYPEVDELKLRIWGEGPARPSLESLAEAIGVSGQLSFEGFVPSERIPRLFEEVDTLVLPRPLSRQAHGGFPTKLGEYLASGTATVVSATSDIPRYVRDSESALLVPPNDVDALSRAIARLAGDPELRATMGAGGRRLAEAQFGMGIGAKMLEDFFIHILGRLS